MCQTFHDLFTLDKHASQALCPPGRINVQDQLKIKFKHVLHLEA